MPKTPGTPVPAAVASGVLAAIAAYAQALDENRPADVAGLFVADGVSEIAGQGTFEGRSAIEAAYAAWPPASPQVHLVTNTLITDWDENTASARSDLALTTRGEAGFAVAFVGRYEDTLRLDDGVWRFSRRVLQFR
ncbi:nuclear transport factor 2 family protein [Kineosporia mesophila]|uniref:Nuclear transport factor 2 family protein n=1 Tax=Kineosporia mesophila TaxID=566012 RepID=A0ABP6ZPF2_9ACTN|nr:nuclear transport factor 2 family protein [Kineosporia mesophila]MCD5354473.1 nuclear transport factor 2 family protein [Kineosporia mesophila]